MIKTEMRHGDFKRNNNNNNKNYINNNNNNNNSSGENICNNFVIPGTL